MLRINLNDESKSDKKLLIWVKSEHMLLIYVVERVP